MALVGLEATHAAEWWRTLAVASAATGACAIAAAGVPLLAAHEVVPFTRGRAGDIFDDLGWAAPAPLRGHPWRLALIVAGGIAVILAAAGIMQSDPMRARCAGLPTGSPAWRGSCCWAATSGYDRPTPSPSSRTPRCG